MIKYAAARSGIKYIVDRERVGGYVGYGKVYNDIVTTIGRGNGAMLVLLDLSAVFNTIDHLQWWHRTIKINHINIIYKV